MASMSIMMVDQTSIRPQGRVMKRLEVDPTVSVKSAIAERLRELRESRRWSIDKFRQVLAEHGVVKHNGELVAQSTVYSWERGPENRGTGLPVELFPVIAEIYGFGSPWGWLPPLARKLRHRRIRHGKAC
jgi:transcriptional regulator with XRE-family HTH domain